MRKFRTSLAFTKNAWLGGKPPIVNIEKPKFRREAAPLLKTKN
jgi:hypothetical protein